jgi:hypothetical protein
VLDKSLFVDEPQSRQPHYRAAGNVVRYWAALWFGWLFWAERILSLGGHVGFGLPLHRDEEKLKGVLVSNLQRSPSAIRDSESDDTFVGIDGGEKCWSISQFAGKMVVTWVTGAESSCEIWKI